MRSVGHYRAMIRVYTIAELMQSMCNDLHDNTTSQEGALRDIIEGINSRLFQIMSIANQEARDEFDFGPNGTFFPHTIEQAVKKVLQEMEEEKSK